MAVHIYDDTGGRRVFNPGKAMLRGVYNCNPHSLMRFDIDGMSKIAGSGTSQRFYYTLVVSQYRKHRNVDFTLNAWSTTAAIGLQECSGLPQHQLEVRGSWDASTSGGSLGNPRFYANPMWTLKVRQGLSNHQLRAFK